MNKFSSISLLKVLTLKRQMQGKYAFPNFIGCSRWIALVTSRTLSTWIFKKEREPGRKRAGGLMPAPSNTLLTWLIMWGWSGTFSRSPPISLPSIYHKASPLLGQSWFWKLTPPIASLIAQLVENTPAMQETPVPFLGQEDLLKQGYATHSSILGLPW